MMLTARLARQLLLATPKSKDNVLTRLERAIKIPFYV